MESGGHSPVPANGDVKGHDATAETPKTSVFGPLSSPSARLLGGGSDAINALLPPDLNDGAADGSSLPGGGSGSGSGNGSGNGSGSGGAAAGANSSSGGGAGGSGSKRSSLQQRVPSRQLLTTALDLAQKAVEMDKGNDVAGALAAYREAVTKLRVVMERVGVDATADGKRSGKNDDEGRTLRGIHDAYMARITLLSAYEGSDVDEPPAAGIGSISLNDSGPNGVSSTPSSGGAPVLSPLSTESSPVNGEAGPSTPLRSPAPSSIMSSRRKRERIQGKQSFGLDEEADLSGVDGVNEDDEEESPSEAYDSNATAKSPLHAKGPSTVDDADDDDNRPLPPLPPSGGGPSVASSEASAQVVAPRKRTTSTSATSDRLMVNTSTTQGTISQRRQHRPAASGSSLADLASGSPRASVSEQQFEVPTRPRTVSTRGGSHGSHATPNGVDEVPQVPKLQPVYRSTLAPPVRLQGSAYRSPRPEPQPDQLVHRPFHLLRILYASMDASGPGAYLTSAIHIDPAVWKPSNWRSTSSGRNGAPRLTGQDAKARCCEVLIGHLETIKRTGASLLEGTREERGNSMSTLSKASIEQVTRVGDELSTLLEALDDELDSTHKALASKGIQVGVWKGKSKSSWGSRFSARVDKMASRTSDSPDRYVDLLSQLFFSCQVIDDHLRCFTGPSTPAYHALPHKTSSQIEMRLTRAAQFIGNVIVPFVMDDFRQFMLGYLKGGVKYLED